MKVNRFIVVLFTIVSILHFFPTSAEALTPEWAPANGYREKTRHIYFPQYNIYYDLKKDMYIYEKDGVWFIIKSVPEKIKHENLKTSAQVQLYLINDMPFTENAIHKSKYNYLVRHDEKSQPKTNRSLKRQQKDIKKNE